MGIRKYKVTPDQSIIIRMLVMSRAWIFLQSAFLHVFPHMLLIVSEKLWLWFFVCISPVSFICVKTQESHRYYFLNLRSVLDRQSSDKSGSYLWQVFSEDWGGLTRVDGVFVPQIGVGLSLCDAVLMQVRSWPQECIIRGMTGVMMLWRPSADIFVHHDCCKSG